MSPASVLLFASILILLLALLLRRASGLPFGEITYSDTDRPAEPLVAEEYGLAGKPDYLVRRGRFLIPIEIKPSRLAAEPYASDVAQLLAYCLLVEATTGVAPPYGLLRYQERTHRITYGQKERQGLLELLEQMRSLQQAEDVARSHDQPGRCQACAMRESCSQRLA